MEVLLRRFLQAASLRREASGLDPEAVHYPSFRLNYFRIFPEGDQIVIEYEEIETDQPRDLTWFQRLVARRPPAPAAIPERTVLDPDGELELPESDETAGIESGPDLVGTNESKIDDNRPETDD